METNDENLADELRRRTEELDEVKRNRERFLSIIVHEIKGPLTVVNGYAQMIQRAIEKGEMPDIKAATAIRAQVERITRLMDSLSDVAQIEAGHLELERAPCDIVRLAQTVVQDQQESTKAHRIILHAPKKAILGNWDCDRLAQALTNLLSNAIRYSPQGTDIEVSVRQNKKEVVVSVVDHSPGIPPEDLPYLFEPFSRLYRKAEVRGVGLGLFITKGIIEAHGGRTWAESTVGAGTKLSFSLPLATLPHGFPQQLRS